MIQQNSFKNAGLSLPTYSLIIVLHHFLKILRFHVLPHQTAAINRPWAPDPAHGEVCGGALDTAQALIRRTARQLAE